MNVPQQKHIRSGPRSRLFSIILLAALILGVVGLPGAQAMLTHRTLSLPSSDGNPMSAAIDTTAGYAYFGTSTGPGKVIKVQLSDFTRVDALTLNTGENSLIAAVSDPSAGFAYFGTTTSPAQIVKVDLATFTRVGSLTLDTGENSAQKGAVIDTTAGFVYFGLATSPGKVVKVRLSDFTRVGALTFGTGEGIPRSAVIDPTGGFAYFGTSDSPGKIVKVRLSDFTEVGALTLNANENSLSSAVIDPAAGFAYFGTGTNPGIVVKVRLSDFTRVDALTFNTGENSLAYGAVIAPSAGSAYFGTCCSPSNHKVVKVNLATFTREDAEQLLSDEGNPSTGVIDTVSGYVYWGLNTSGPGQGAKIIRMPVSNHVPVAVDDSFSTAQDLPLTEAAPGVLGNDTEPDGTPFTAVKTSDPAHGTVDLSADGSFTYTPNAGYTGSDSFTYKATDGAADSNVATVTITVNAAPNTAPVAVDDNYSRDSQSELDVDAPGVLTNDTDADSDPLTAVKVSNPAHGIVGLNPDGSFSYIPQLGFSGPDSFTYKANDGTTDSNVATVNIIVNPTNQAPVAVNDSYSTDVNAPLTIADPGVLGNDTDADLDLLTAIKMTEPAHGAVTLSADGGFTYTPTTDYVGPDSFTYKATDGVADSNVAAVNITILPPEGDAGLLGYWKFDDGAGATALDASDYHRDGTVSGGATWSADAAPITNYGNPGAISMSSSTGLVTVPNSAINRLTNNFTVMGWIKPSSIGPVQRLISSALTTTSGNGWGFGLNSSWLYFTTYGVKSYLTPASTGMKAGQWHHVAAVMDSSNAVTFYVDGVPAGTVPHTAPAIADTDDALLIGARTNSGSTTPAEAFNGQIDDVRVFNRALSATEVAEQVGTPPCSETVFRARAMLGEASPSKTITLDGACTYTLATVGDTWNGGNGVYLRYATAIEGNGATIERAPAAPKMRVMTTSPAITINNLTLRGGDVLASGGGIYAWGNLTLNNVRFESNTIDHPAGVAYVNVGGAVYAAADIIADRAVFVNNQADGYGGAIYTKGTTTTVQNSIFADNLSGSPGAAIHIANTSGSLTLLNNTFSNQYQNPKEALLLNGTATVTNNIFDNFQVGMTASGASAVVTEDYNLFTATDVATRTINDGGITGGGHDRIAAAPRFVDVANRDYRLQSNSPAIDFGAATGAPTDAAGNPRPATNGTAVDIGAYEYQGVGVPSISITKTGPPYVSTGAQFRFIVAVINEGSDSLDDLRVVDPLPAGATYVVDSASNGGVFSSGSLTWDVGPLASGQSKRFEYKVTATQTLVSEGYSVSSISNPAITSTGSALTTPFDTSARASGFFPYPDGYSFPNYGDVIETSDVTVDDMIKIYGVAVCKTQDPCVLTASAEAVRKAKATTSTGGHCAGMAAAGMEIFDDATVNPSDFQAGATVAFDLSKANARNLIAFYMSTQGDNAANTAGLPTTRNIPGATAIVDALLANYADPNPADRYLLSLYDINGGSGHRVTPYAVVQQPNPDEYWIYTYDNNYPNNYNRVFKVTYSTGAWIYEGGATHPSAPPSDYRDDGSQPNHLILRSYRWADAFPKTCTSACAPPTFSKLDPANAATGVASNPTLIWEATDGATDYYYCYDTTNDNNCSVWYINGASTSRTLSGLAANTTYYWQVRAKNSYGYTYANGGSTAHWSFTTAAPGMTSAQTLAPARVAEVLPPTYEFQLEGEGRLMITRSDGKRAGIDPVTGAFVAEIPGAEEVPYEGGSGLDIPSGIRILHETGMTYNLRVSDTHNAFGNASATADLNIFGPGTVTRLTGLKIDSPADPETPAGSNDVMGVTYDPENHSLSFQSSSLDSDTPTLGMAISQSGMPDFTFEIGGAQMPSGNTINVAFDPVTGKLTVTNDDPASNDYAYDVERINLDGSKTSYSGTTGDGAGQGVSLDLGPNWTGGAPTTTQVNAALKLETTTPTFCIQDTATIDLKLADVVGLYGYQVDVTYDSSKVYAAGALDNAWFDTTTDAFVPGGYDGTCAGGWCRFGASKVSPATPLNGSGRLGVITLAGHTAGTFNLTVTSSILSDIDGTPLTHEVVNLPLTICGLSTVSGKITMQGRATPINTGTVTLTDPTGAYGPYTVDFSAADGTWTITGVRAAASGTSYKLKADHGLYLFSEKDLTVQPSTTYTDQNTKLWGGDANNDESVTIGDLSCIGGAFGSWAPCGTTGGSDINADGTTNIQDLSIAGGNYTKTSPQPW